MPPVALLDRVTGPSTAPVVVLGGSLGSTHHLWDELVADLSADHRVVAFDTRGHGGSPSAFGEVTMTDLAADVTALADRLGITRFSYVGISLGGAIGQQLALDAPDRLERLVLACAAPWFGGPSSWNERAATVRAEGLGALRKGTTERWFTEAVRSERPHRVAEVMDAFVANDAESYAVVCGALGRFDVRDRLGEIRAPTLVVSADQDQVAPPETIDTLVTRIPGAAHETLAPSAHLANLCRPEEFNAVVRRHLDG